MLTLLLGVLKLYDLLTLSGTVSVASAFTKFFNITASHIKKGVPNA